MKFVLMFVSAMAIGATASTKPRDRVGNGGDVLVCDVEGQKTYEMLDTYQARVDFKLSVSPYPDSPYKDIVIGILRRLKYQQPRLARQYLDIFMKFESEADFLPGITLVDVPDTGAQVIPSNCHVEQIAVQRASDEILPGQKRYVISKDLWDHLDEFNKAVLVLHEIVYNRSLGLLCAPPSVFVRYLTSHLIVDDFDLVDFQGLLLQSRQGTFEIGAASFLVDWKNSRDSRCDLSAPSEIYGLAGEGVRFPVHSLAFGFPQFSQPLRCFKVLQDYRVSYEHCWSPGPIEVNIEDAGKAVKAWIEPESFTLAPPMYPLYVWKLSQGRLAADVQLSIGVCKAGQYFNGDWSAPRCWSKNSND